MRLRPAVLLDRDGVINRDGRDYVKSWEEFQFYPGVLSAIAKLTEAKLEVYVITNQAGVGRGIMSRRRLQDMHTKMQLEIARAGGRISGIQVCPHSPDDGCRCRKPQPGLLLKAAAKWGLDLRRSYFVGDAARDIQAGHAVGCTTIFLHTHATDQLRQRQEEKMTVPPDFQAPDLAAAVRMILSSDNL